MQLSRKAVPVLLLPRSTLVPRRFELTCQAPLYSTQCSTYVNHIHRVSRQPTHSLCPAKAYQKTSTALVILFDIIWMMSSELTQTAGIGNRASGHSKCYPPSLEMLDRTLSHQHPYKVSYRSGPLSWLVPAGTYVRESSGTHLHFQSLRACFGRRTTLPPEVARRHDTE